MGSAFGAFGIHAAWGLSDSSEQFLFLSGFVLASVHTLKADRDGAAAAARDIWRRAGRLWLVHLLLFLMTGALILWAEMGIPLPTTALVFQYYRALQQQGLGGEGNHALVKALEQLAGREIGGQ